MAATKLLLLLFSVTLLGLSSAQSQDEVNLEDAEEPIGEEQNTEESIEMLTSLEAETEEQDVVAKARKNVSGKSQGGKKNRGGKPSHAGPPNSPGSRRNSGSGGRPAGQRDGSKRGRRPGGQEGGQRGVRPGGPENGGQKSSRPRRQ